MNKICVIFTGGTIGSVVNAKGVVVPAGAAQDSLTAAYKKFDGSCAFEQVSLFNILSENMSAEHLRRLSDTLSALDHNAYAGIIITHGSDTLAYTAAYLSVMSTYIRLPIILVAADYPLQDDRSNGASNFVGAVDFILNTAYPGIFAAYGNPGETCKIHLGSRLRQAEQFSGYVNSVGGLHFGEISCGHFRHNGAPRNPTPEALQRPRYAGYDTAAFRLSDEVMYIRTHTAINWRLYDFSQTAPKAVVVELYHSGTIGTAGDFAFSDFHAYCRKLDIPVILTMPGESVYTGADLLPSLPGIIFSRSSAEMTLIKTMLACGSLPREQWREFIEDTDFFFENISI